MSRLPIRIRLTLAFAAAMALVLGMLGIVVYTRFENSLDDNVDQSLRSRANELVGPVAHSGRLPEVRSGAFLEAEESFVQVLDPQGRLVEGTPPADRRPLLGAEELRRTREGPLTITREDAVEDGDPARLFAVVTAREDVLVVGQDIEDNEEALATLRLLLLVGLPVTLVLASLGAYALAGRALRPVAEALERERGFVADASHELRTPLAVLKTELELALREGRSEGELREALRSASEETDRLTRLADDLLVLARSDRGTLDLKVERVAVGDLLDRVARRFRAVADVEVSPADGLAIRADALRLEQALGNLVANAAQHGRAPIRISARRADGTVELHVEDAGTGLPPEFADGAFERFTRADASRTGGGAGLGLAIVDAIARAHGGRAGASGADVWIALPASGADDDSVEDED